MQNGLSAESNNQLQCETVVRPIRLCYVLCNRRTQTESRSEETSPAVRAGAAYHDASAANVTPDM